MTEHTKARTEELLAVALTVAAEHGYNRMTRDQIAAAAHVSPALVSARLGTMDAMRRSVMRAAVKGNVLKVIAQGVLARDRHALAAPIELQRAAMVAQCL